MSPLPPPDPSSSYLDFPALTAWCQDLARLLPQWISLESLGKSRHGRDLWLLTLHGGDRDPSHCPTLWLDGGTHAAEWAGVMACLSAAHRWAMGLANGEEELCAWFRSHTVCIAPCISPDGFQALHDGAPFLRSTLRLPRESVHRQGLDPRDLDGDGVVRWMRWRDRGGAFALDPEAPLGVRPRRLDDDPSQACFLCSEGDFLHWDGMRWTGAPLLHGLDLNRNFPAHWTPFSMFGMDGGDYPLSEPESRAVMEAVVARPGIAAVVTHHTYTGCLLTQPYRADSPLSDPDILLMEHLAREAVEGTGYRVFRTHPDFTYDPKRAIVGVWADTLATVLGIPGYTLEIWDPYGDAGIEVKDPAKMFFQPDAQVVSRLMGHFASQPGAVSPWRPFLHPQLGEVELGGLDYLRTIRNPPLPQLPLECDKAFRIVEKMRLSLPQIRVEAKKERVADGIHRVEVQLDNLGFLGTSPLRRGEEIGATPKVTVELLLPEGVRLREGATVVALPHLSGWGDLRVGEGRHGLYPGLSSQGNRAVAVFWVEGDGGPMEVRWKAGRAGRGRVAV